MIGNSMKAWVQFGFGNEEVMKFETVPMPKPKKGEVLIKIAATSINRLDLIQRKMQIINGFKLPHIGGMDISGTVVEATNEKGEELIGKNVVIDPIIVCGKCDCCLGGLKQYCHNLKSFGMNMDGGFAEYIALPVENCIIIDNDKINIIDMAAIPVASVTAWHALNGVGKGISSGETIVIPGAGSGLGSAGIQIAKNKGCKVITIVSGNQKVEKAKNLGADLVIDRKKNDWVKETLEFTNWRGADMVWDHVGGPFLQQAIDATCIEGRIIMTGTTAGNDSKINNTSLFQLGKSILGHGGYTHDEMEQVVKAYCNNELIPVIDSIWEFPQLLEATRHLESGDFFGKIIVKI